MSDMDDLDGVVRERRTATFPVVAVPARAAQLGACALLAGALASVASGAIEALSYRVPQLNPGSGSGAITLTLSRVSVADRLLMLTRGAGAFAALLVLLGAVCLVVGGQSEDELERWRARVLAAAAGLAAIILLANGALVVEILRRASGALLEGQLANQLASIVGLLAPIALSGGTLFYVYVRLTAEPADLQP